MKKLILLLVLILPVWINAQEADTIYAKQIMLLEQQVDSLRRTLGLMDKEMQNIKQSMIVGESEIDEVLSILGEEDVESATFEARSRYKRVNDLLKAIQQRPGQLLFNGNVTAISQFSTNNNATESYGTGSFDIFATTSFGKGTILFIDLEAIGGDGPDVLYPTFSGLNGDAGSTQSPDGMDRIHVLEAWGEFTLLNEIFTITVGKIDITNYFDNNASANDETTQFISGSFINNSSFAVPSNSPGFRLRTTLFNKYHLQFGLSSQDNAGGRLFNDLYRIGSLGFTFAPGSGFDSNIRMYGYQVPAANNEYGYGVSLDKVFFNKFNVFGRYGLNHDTVADYWGIKSSWSAGLRFVELIKDQPLAIGLAYGENYSNNNNPAPEKITELYIRRQLNKWVHISPHFQYIWNRKGTNEELAVIGIRTHFNF